MGFVMGASMPWPAHGEEVTLEEVTLEEVAVEVAVEEVTVEEVTVEVTVEELAVDEVLVSPDRGRLLSWSAECSAECPMEPSAASS